MSGANMPENQDEIERVSNAVMRALDGAEVLVGLSVLGQVATWLIAAHGDPAYE